MRGFTWALPPLALGLLAAAAGATDWLGRPVAAGPAAPSAPSFGLGRPRALVHQEAEPAWRPVAYEPAPVGLAAPTIRAQAADPGAPPPPAPPPGGAPIPPPPPRGGSPFIPGSADERYNCGVATEPPNRPWYENAWSKMTNWGGDSFGASSRSWFQSDPCFPEFISPVTNPFLFEDPRSLTELRPIILYQKSPDRNPAFPGGSQQFYGLQGRLALTDRWSFVMNKLGFVSIQPDNPALQDATGLSEINIGPKYTFLRNDQTKTLGAFGVTFEIPTGPRKVFQDTGSLSVVPYFSFGKSFGRSSYGGFNFLSSLGYSFGDAQRSDYYFSSLHLDYDIANAHRFYPLLELNWFHYTKNGSASTLGTEGRDLINFGSVNSKGHDDISIAPGFRYKFSECVQTGLAAEFPLNGARDILDFRLTFDVIFRY